MELPITFASAQSTPQVLVIHRLQSLQHHLLSLSQVMQL
jgi:hypothetical protein